MGDAYITRRGGGGKNLDMLLSRVARVDNNFGSGTKSLDVVTYGGRYAFYCESKTVYFIDTQTGEKVSETFSSSVSYVQVFSHGIAFTYYQDVYVANPQTMTITQVYEDNSGSGTIQYLTPVQGGILFKPSSKGYIYAYIYGNTSAYSVTSFSSGKLAPMLNGCVIAPSSGGGIWLNAETQQTVNLSIDLYNTFTQSAQALAAGDKIIYSSRYTNDGLWMLDTQTNEKTQLLASGISSVRYCVPVGGKFLICGYSAALFDPDTNTAAAVANSAQTCMAFRFGDEILIAGERTLRLYDAQSNALGESLVTDNDDEELLYSDDIHASEVPGVGGIITNDDALKLALYKSADKSVELISVTKNNAQMLPLKSGCLLYSNASSASGLSYFDYATLAVTLISSGFYSSGFLYCTVGECTLIYSQNYSGSLYMFDESDYTMSIVDNDYTNYGGFVPWGQGILYYADDGIYSVSREYTLYRPFLFSVTQKKVYELGAVIRAIATGGANDTAAVYVKKEG